MSVGIIFVVVLVFMIVRFILRGQAENTPTKKYRDEDSSSFLAGSSTDLFDTNTTNNHASHHQHHSHHSGHDSGSHSWGGDSGGHGGGSDGGGSDGGGGGGGD